MTVLRWFWYPVQPVWPLRILWVGLVRNERDLRILVPRKNPRIRMGIELTELPRMDERTIKYQLWSWFETAKTNNNTMTSQIEMQEKLLELKNWKCLLKLAKGAMTTIFTIAPEGPRNLAATKGTGIWPATRFGERSDTLFTQFKLNDSFIGHLGNFRSGISHPPAYYRLRVCQFRRIR